MCVILECQPHAQIPAMEDDGTSNPYLRVSFVTTDAHEPDELERTFKSTTCEKTLTPSWAELPQMYYNAMLKVCYCLLSFEDAVYASLAVA